MPTDDNFVFRCDCGHDLCASNRDRKMGAQGYLFGRREPVEETLGSSVRTRRRRAG